MPEPNPRTNPRPLIIGAAMRESERHSLQDLCVHGLTRLVCYSCNATHCQIRLHIEEYRIQFGSVEIADSFFKSPNRRPSTTVGRAMKRFRSS